MSASTPQLPARASLEYLRKQAKDLHRAVAAGDSGAIERIRRHLPRAGSLAPEELNQAGVSLQEAQHALASEYGFRRWVELLAAVQPCIDDICRLTDRETQILMREVSRQDLIPVLRHAPEAIREKLLRNVSSRIREMLNVEVSLQPDVGKGELKTRVDRVLGEIERLTREGWICWPPVDEAQSTGPKPDHTDEPVFANLRRPLLDLSEDELAQTLLALAVLARDEGIFALEALLPGDHGSLLTEALRYVVDGMEPDLVTDLIETRGVTILRRRTLRGHMAIEGWMSVQSLDNPSIVGLKLGTYFLDETSLEAYEARSPQVEELVARLQKEPLSRTTDSRIGEFYRDMAFVARQQGLEALSPLISVADDEVLVAGMRGTLEDDNTPDEFLKAMRDQLQDVRLRLRRREWMVVAGIEAIQKGQTPEQTVSASRAAADEGGARLLGAGQPGMAD
jgi:hypothetical protein